MEIQIIIQTGVLCALELYFLMPGQNLHITGSQIKLRSSCFLYIYKDNQGRVT